MNGFNRRSASLIQKILSASADLLATQGVKKTSINQISKKAHVSPVTIYNYLGSRASIVTETVKYLASSYPQIYKNSPENHQLINEIWRIYLYGLMGQETHPELFSVSRPRAEERD